MKSRSVILSTGLALFSMFFGSGNLVFPITVGKESGGHFILATLGILLTGVIVPFLGVLGITLYKGNLNEFFRCFGKKGMFLFTFLALALMGPFGVLARCLTVAHGALLLLLPDVSLVYSSLCMCIVIYFLTVNKSKIVSLLGSYLTPFLLFSIACIAFFGLKDVNFPDTQASSSWFALKNGFFQGYQTMDLLASFFFSRFVLSSLYHRFPSETSDLTLLKHFGKSSVIGAGILSVIYFSLVVLGNVYAPVLKDTPPQEMLGVIAMHSLGSFAAPCVCLSVVFACLTTAMVLASLFGDFLREEISQNRLSNKVSLAITLGLGFFVSTFDFAGIAKFIGPLLEAVYPALIAMTIVNIFTKLLGMRATHWPFTLTLFAKLSLI